MLGARLASGTSGIMSVTVGVLYLLPEQLVRRPLQPGQVSAVVLIESLGPWWTILFVGTGLMLIAAALRRRGFVNAHISAAGVWAFYAGCVLFSAVLAVPPGSRCQRHHLRVRRRSADESRAWLRGARIEVSVDPSLIAAIGGLVTAIGAVVSGLIATRSKVKLDDVALLQRKLDEAEDDLEAERAARSADLDTARTQRNADLDAQRARHDAEIARLEGRIAVLEDLLDARDKQITKLDRIVLAARGYIATLSRTIFDYGGTPPPRPNDLD